MGRYSTISGGNGNDSIYNSWGGYSVKINAGAGNDSIYNSGDLITINSGAGNDSIDNSGDLVTINAGAGNDYIYNEDGNNVTNSGGKGNDSISISSYYSKNNLIQYKLGDSNDTIWGFNENDTPTISGGSYSTQTSGNDVLVKVGKGSILLKNPKNFTSANIVQYSLWGEDASNFIYSASDEQDVISTFDNANISQITSTLAKSNKSISYDAVITTDALTSKAHSTTTFNTQDTSKLIKK